MASIGDIPMPENFRYREIFQKGKPRHCRTDPFRARHPCMDLGRRAKIFAPFDALKGFSEAVAAKDVLYTDRHILNEEEQSDLNRKLDILHELTINSRQAKANSVKVDITYFSPCTDIDNEACGLRGQYKTLSGVCMNVDAEDSGTILIGDTRIDIGDILRIDGVGLEEPMSDSFNYNII